MWLLQRRRLRRRGRVASSSHPSTHSKWSAASPTLEKSQQGWTVSARVFGKSPIRAYANEKGPGQVAHITLIDATGSMKAVMFGDQVDRLYHGLEVGKVYRILGGQVRPVRPSVYEAPTSEYEIVLTQDSRIEPESDNGSVPAHSLHPVRFSELPDQLARQQQMGSGSGSGSGVAFSADVIGIVVQATPMVDIMTKKQQMLKKREVTLVDTTAATVKLTIWGDKELDPAQLVTFTSHMERSTSVGQK